jgi:hypothetical protein
MIRARTELRIVNFDVRDADRIVARKPSPE